MKRVTLLMGGYSVERDVSLASGENCAAALREAGYPVEVVDVKGHIRDVIAVASNSATAARRTSGLRGKLSSNRSCSASSRCPERCRTLPPAREWQTPQILRQQ